MSDPIAVMKLNNGKKIVMRLRPDYAYNEVCSFISAATKGYYDNFAIQRIVPGSWVDVSYNAFFRRECQYFLPNRIEEESMGTSRCRSLATCVWDIFRMKRLQGRSSSSL